MNSELIAVADYLKRKLLEAKADDSVVAATNIFSRQLKFVNNKVVKTGTETLSSIAIFSVWKKRIVETVLREPTKKAADEIVARIAKFSKFVREKEDYFGIAEGPFKYKKLPYDTKILKFHEKQVDIVERAINRALEVAKVRTSGIFELHNTEKYLTSSRGVEAQSKRVKLYFSIRAVLDREASGHKVLCGRSSEKDIEEAARVAAEIAKASLNPKMGPSGRYDVVFEPLAFANLLQEVGRAASIFEVEAGVSFLGGKIGKKVAAPSVTLIDDGTLPDGYFSTPFDAEGVPTRQNVIIKDGFLKTYLHNTSTARKYGTTTTANAGLIAPHPWNIILAAGRIKKEELLSEMKKGIYVTNVWYTRFHNFIAGDFSTIPRDGAFLIEHGKFIPIKHIRINENMLRMLKNISAITNEPENIHSWEVGSVITPAVCVKNVHITKPIA